MSSKAAACGTRQQGSNTSLWCGTPGGLLRHGGHAELLLPYFVHCITGLVAVFVLRVAAVVAVAAVPADRLHCSGRPDAVAGTGGGGRQAARCTRGPLRRPHAGTCPPPHQIPHTWPVWLQEPLRRGDLTSCSTRRQASAWHWHTAPHVRIVAARSANGVLTRHVPLGGGRGQVDIDADPDGGSLVFFWSHPPLHPFVPLNRNWRRLYPVHRARRTPRPAPPRRPLTPRAWAGGAGQELLLELHGGCCAPGGVGGAMVLRGGGARDGGGPRPGTRPPHGGGGHEPQANIQGARRRCVLMGFPLRRRQCTARVRPRGRSTGIRMRVAPRIAVPCRAEPIW
jgi:hypothetical protein